MLLLQQLREQRGWSIFQLAIEAKIHPATIGKLENERMKPYKPHLEKFEKIFGIPGHELFKGVE